MSLQELRLTVNAEDIDAISEVLEGYGSHAISIVGASDEEIFDLVTQENISWEDDLPMWRKSTIAAMFTDLQDVDRAILALKSQFAERINCNLSIHDVADQDWATAWKQHFQPLQFGERLWVHPSWITPPDISAVNVVLDPGMAFGTGHHATTALCLEWLAQQGNLTAKKLIDYGCGSGILAVAAVKLGAENVWAVDIDPQALTVCRETVMQNHVDERIKIMLPTEFESLKVDILLANILVGPLRQLAPYFAELLTKDGIVVLSGILSAQIDECQSVYQKWFKITHIVEKNGWGLIQGQRL